MSTVGTSFDTMLAVLSPQYAVKRLKARAQYEYYKRAFDAAKSFKSDDWTSATSKDANAETLGAITAIRNKARDAVRNNPYANKGLNVLVSNTVGAGILPNIRHETSVGKTKKVNELWKLWGETTECDANKMHDFSGLQALAFKSLVESGEILVKKHQELNKFGLMLLEGDYIDTTKDKEDIEQGVQTDGHGRATGYWIYERHPGGKLFKPKSIFIPGDKIINIYRVDRVGQLRGVSWFHTIIRTLEDFKNFQDATLIRQKIAACFAAFITPAARDNQLSNEDLTDSREKEAKVFPGMMKYLNEGESIAFASPPGVEGYAEYSRQTLRAVAAGLGSTYEALTGDYSQVNYSSGRMGHLEFRKNVDSWRWNILPRFNAFGWEQFKVWAELNHGMNFDSITVDWVPPAWSMIDPNKEYEATSKAMRNGLMSPQKAIREQGEDPDLVLGEIQEWNKKLDKSGVVLDSDARDIAKAKQAQNNQPQSNGDKDSESEDDETNDKAGQT